MKKNITFIIATLLTVTLVVLLYMQTGVKKGVAPKPIKTVPQDEPFLILNLQTQNGSGQKGTAAFFEKDKGQVRVVVAVNDIKLKGQPVNIQQGNCQYPGLIAHSLIPLVNGKSETTIVTSQSQLQLIKPWVVNIGNPPPEVRRSTACAEFK